MLIIRWNNGSSIPGFELNESELTEFVKDALKVIHIWKVFCGRAIKMECMQEDAILENIDMSIWTLKVPMKTLRKF